MPLIQDPGISRKLQRLLRLTSPADSILGAEVVPVIVVDDVSDDFAGGIDRRCMGSQGVAAVAAENCLVVLGRVGSPSTYRCRVTRVHFSSAGAGLIRVRIPTTIVTGLVASANSQFADLEIPGRPTSELGSDTNAGLPPGRDIIHARVLADTTYSFDLNVDLGAAGIGPSLPQIMIVSDTVNVLLDGGFDWTESAPLG